MAVVFPNKGSFTKPSTLSDNLLTLVNVSVAFFETTSTVLSNVLTPSTAGINDPPISVVIIFVHAVIARAAIRKKDTFFFFTKDKLIA